jgi:hypothetical protein
MKKITKKINNLIERREMLAISIESKIESAADPISEYRKIAVLKSAIHLLEFRAAQVEAGHKISYKSILKEVLK